MAKKGRRRPEDDLDFGIDPSSDEDETTDVDSEDTIQEEKPVEETDMQKDTHIPFFISRTVPDDEDVSYRGVVKGDDLPGCVCCGKKWNVNEANVVTSPGCGCLLHPYCKSCGKCAAHCICRYKR